MLDQTQQEEGVERGKDHLVGVLTPSLPTPSPSTPKLDLAGEGVG